MRETRENKRFDAKLAPPNQAAELQQEAIRRGIGLSPGVPMLTSLCHHCEHMREITSGKGTRFFLCQKSLSDRQYPKYPPQPVVQCAGFEQRGTEDESTIRR